ncbi:unnamed protein product [Prorocentrum cordatum]|uniref:Uncharacterized protein n=1 Tax=Prorocentrum cordatum TaxID=2364126 RepID=A0ABN9STP0_9DINO|nr:unnamed protein product [Polarella glacialis]
MAVMPWPEVLPFPALDKIECAVGEHSDMVENGKLDEETCTKEEFEQTVAANSGSFSSPLPEDRAGALQTMKEFLAALGPAGRQGQVPPPGDGGSRHPELRARRGQVLKGGAMGPGGGTASVPSPTWLGPLGSVALVGPSWAGPWGHGWASVAWRAAAGDG